MKWLLRRPSPTFSSVFPAKLILTHHSLCLPLPSPPLPQSLLLSLAPPLPFSLCHECHLYWWWLLEFTHTYSHNHSLTLDGRRRGEGRRKEGGFGEVCGKEACHWRQKRSLCLSVSMSLLRSRLHSDKDRQCPACCATSGFKSAGLLLGLSAHYSTLPHLNGRQSWTAMECTNGEKQFGFSCAFKSFLAFKMSPLFFFKSVFIRKLIWALSLLYRLFKVG